MKFTRLFLLIFILLCLAACGGGEETNDFPTPPTTAADDSELEVAVPEAVSPDDNASAAAVEEAPAPTAELPPTDTPEPAAETQPQSSAGGWGESGTTAQTACDHPYFPMRPGATWTFSDGADSGMTWEILEVQGDLQQATATMQMTTTGGDLTFNYIWECSADEGLVSFDFANQGFSQMGFNMDVQVVDGSGQFLPPPEDLTPGFTWDMIYNSTFSFTIGEGDQGMETSGDLNFAQTNTVISDDPVTFAGSTADGLQIQQEDKMLMTMNVLENGVTNEIPMTNLMELGRGVGVVRQTSSSAEFDDITMELVEWYIP